MIEEYFDIPAIDAPDCTIMLRDKFDSVGLSAGDRIVWIDAQSELAR